MKNLKIKIGKFIGNYEINKLKQSLVNRDVVENHVQTFMKIINNNGFLTPITVTDKNDILEGHHRILAAERLGMNTVPVYIVDWVDSNDLNESQKCIISLNANNRKWTALDYLKSFSMNKESYRFVLSKYNKTKDIFSVGNLLNIYFNSGSNVVYRNGLSKIKDKDFSDFLFENFLKLKREYGGVKFQAFTINRVCSFSHQKIKNNKKEMNFIFNQLELLAKTDNAILSSVEMIKPWLIEQLKMYRNK